MTKIDLSKFLQNNFDEFVHLRALKNVIDQVDSINAQQDTNISHAQTTADTAQQTATTAESNADKAQQSADAAQTTADGKSTFNYQKADGTSSFAKIVTMVDVKRADVDGGKTSIGKAFVCLGADDQPLDGISTTSLLSITGAMKMFAPMDKTDSEVNYNGSIKGVNGSTIHIIVDPVLLHDGTVNYALSDIDIKGDMSLDDLIQSHAFSVPFDTPIDERCVGIGHSGNLHVIADDKVVTLPVSLNFSADHISVEIDSTYTSDILANEGIATGKTYNIEINQVGKV